MIGQKELVPKRRFEGYTSDWQLRKWIDTVDISTNMVDPKTGKYDELLHLGPGNIESFTGRVLDNIKKVKDENLISGKFHFKRGDVIYGKINPQLGKYVLSNFEGLASADAYVLNTKNGVLQDFLYIILQTSSFYKYSVSVSSRTGMPKINRDELNQYSFWAPLLEEQQKIGQFFKHLDEMIALEQRKIKKTKALKSAYLAEMFPGEGEHVPKSRFEGFTGEWKEWEVSEIGNSYYGGGTPKTSKNEYWDGDIPWIQSSDVDEDILHVYEPKSNITEEGLKNSAAKLIPENSIAVVTRVGVGKLALIPYGYSTSQDFLSISNLNVDSQFGTYVLYKLLQKKKNAVQGTSIKGITKDSLLSMKVLITNEMEEQQKIGSFFKKLDDTIFRHQQKLDKLKATKQAYLHEMFV